MGNANFKPCCEAWEHAHDDGTDSEGFTSLVWYTDGLDSRPYMSCVGSAPGAVSELPPIRFCPWCGAEKDVQHA